MDRFPNLCHTSEFNIDNYADYKNLLEDYEYRETDCDEKKCSDLLYKIYITVDYGADEDCDVVLPVARQSKLSTMGSKLIRHLLTKTNTKKLYVENWSTIDDHIQAILPLLEGSNLHALGFKNVQLSCHSLSLLVKSINSLTKPRFTLFLHALEHLDEKHLNILSTLQCHRLRISRTNARINANNIGKCLSFLCVQRLDLHFKVTTKQQACDLLEGLGSNRHLTKLTLNCPNLFTLSDPSHITFLFNSQTITYMKFRFSKINARHITYIGECLKTNTCLKTLSLGATHLFIDGIPPEWHTFLEALCYNLTLDSLYLTYNYAFQTATKLSQADYQKIEEITTHANEDIARYLTAHRHNVVFSPFFSKSHLKQTLLFMHTFNIHPSNRDADIRNLNDALASRKHIKSNRTQRSSTLIQTLLQHMKKLEEDSSSCSVDKHLLIN